MKFQVLAKHIAGNHRKGTNLASQPCLGGLIFWIVESTMELPYRYLLAPNSLNLFSAQSFTYNHSYQMSRCYERLVDYLAADLQCNTTDASCLGKAIDFRLFDQRVIGLQVLCRYQYQCFGSHKQLMASHRLVP